jgi:lipopolysaccharide/colanic/teichoic acid biosynthesis glycosyltransferase
LNVPSVELDSGAAAARFNPRIQPSTQAIPASRPLDLAFRPPSIQERHGERIATAAGWTGRPVGGVAKRAFDLVVALAALCVLALPLAVVWALVRLESPGPGLFRQRRGGFQGRPFYIYKFRTMTACESRTITQARQVDDRVTRVGRFLRRTSIDELPQLLNVLLGDMSIVGPRPHALGHDRLFSTMDRRYCGRHRARPGITGLAQVSGARGQTDTREKVQRRLEFDLRYVASWSLLLDLQIMVRTVLVLFRDRDVF